VLGLVKCRRGVWSCVLLRGIRLCGSEDPGEVLVWRLVGRGVVVAYGSAYSAGRDLDLFGVNDVL
jgi:hypothetical protein